MVPGIDQRHVVARDGTRIGYQVRGEGPCVVLANGLGGTYIAFRHLYDALDGYKTICWDYRGLYTSARAGGSAREHDRAPGRRSDRRSSTRSGVDDVRASSAGRWACRSRSRRSAATPTRVHGLFAINGTYGRAFRTVMGIRLVGQTIPMLLRLVRAQAALVGRATKRRRRLGCADRRDEARRPGLARRSTSRSSARSPPASSTIDWVIYSDLLARLDEHDAEDVLADDRRAGHDRHRRPRSDDAAVDRRAHAPRDRRARAWS